MKVRAAVVTVGLVAASLVTPLVASAQETTQNTATNQEQNQRRRFVAMDTITGLLGVSRGDVISHIRTGGTIAGLADENGSSGDAVVGALMEVVDARIEEALDAGNIDVERADEIRVTALDRIGRLVFETHERPRGRWGNPGIGSGEFRSLVMDTIQDALDINQGELVSHIRTGGTLTELAEENGSDGPTLESVIVAAISDRIDQAETDGALTPEQADRWLERATERIGWMMNKVFKPGKSR